MRSSLPRLLPRLLLLVLAVTAATACLDAPLPDVEPLARLITTWDPVECGEPHRVVLELEDERGADLSRSVPCEIGAITLDLPRWGVYRGRVYAWHLEPSDVAEIRSVVSVRLEVDAPIVHWYVDTPL